MAYVKNGWFSVKYSLRIPANGIIKVCILQTPIPLLILVRTSLICEAKLSLMSVYIPRSFVEVE